MKLYYETTEIVEEGRIIRQSRDVQVLQNMPELTHLSIHNTPIDKLPDELDLSTLEYLEIDEWQLNNTERID